MTDRIRGQLGLDEIDPDFTAPALLRVTPARFSTWQDCPRRYRLRYVDRPTPPGAGARAPSTLGAVVHLALRSLFTQAGSRRTPGAAAALVDRHWSGEGFRDVEQAERYRDAARSWVSSYAADLPRQGPVEPVGVERWVSAAAGGIMAQGRVDRIDDRDGELVIVDYKTGRTTPGAPDARGSLALALYAVAVARTWRRPCRRVELHHLPSGVVASAEHDTDSVRRHLSAAEESAGQAQRAVGALDAGGCPEQLFPTRPAARCGSCEMRRHCAPGQAAAPKSPSWSGLVELPAPRPGRVGPGPGR